MPKAFHWGYFITQNPDINMINNTEKNNDVVILTVALVLIVVIFTVIMMLIVSSYLLPIKNFLARIILHLFGIGVSVGSSMVLQDMIPHTTNKTPYIGKGNFPCVSIPV